MAQEGMSPTTFTAGADLSALQHTFVKFDTTTAFQVLGAGAGEEMMGVLRNKPASGKAASVDSASGTVVKLKVDGSGVAIVVGDYLKSGAFGVGVKSALDTEKVGAKALQASTAAGDIIAAMLVSPGSERSV